MENLTRNATGNLTQAEDDNSSYGMEPPPFLHETQSGQAIIVFLALQGVLIICANSLVFLLFASTRYLRTKTNYCLVSLAASDFLAGFVSLPLVLVCSSTFSPVVCTSMDLFHRFQSISTILHLLVATSERYFKIKRPFKYNILVTKRRVVILLASVWIFSLSASFVQLTWITANLTEEMIYKFDFGYAAFCLVALAFLPFFIIVCIDGHIFYFIHKEKKMRRALTQGSLLKTQVKQKRKQNDSKAALIYAVMTVTFVLGWFPYFIISLLTDLGYSTPMAVNTILLFLKFSTALINPLLYTFFKTDFRKALQAMLERDNGSDGSNELITTTV
ncbi:hypothetical protein ACROYT_G013628 [Oculina patagonica]